MAKSDNGAATTAEVLAEKKERKPRKPTEFMQQIRLSLFVHKKTGAKFLAQAFGDAIANAGIVDGDVVDDEGNAVPFAHRVVARTREGSKSTIQSVSIYVAPNGYEFPSAEGGGVRINADLWAEIKAQLEARGLPASQDGLKALADALAATAPSTTEEATPAA